MGLERGSLSLVSTIEEILGKNSSGSGLEIREYGRRDSSRRPRVFPEKLALTSPTKGGSLGRYSSLADLWICNQELWPLDHKGELIKMCTNYLKQSTSKTLTLQISMT
jgi:hypothetical protein